MLKPFKLTAKQILARRMINTSDNSLLYGGSRSGKTYLFIRNIFLRAVKMQSRHLICRFRFNHAKTALWYDTIPKVLQSDPDLAKIHFHYNKSDWFITCPANNGGESTIWLGGLDQKERTEKILGNEYSTIYINEASQIDYDSVVMLRTRLAENSGLELKEYIDCNPSGKGHWTYQEYILGLVPGTKEKSKVAHSHMLMNPFDNIENLPAKYITILENLPKRARQRFLLGLYLTDVEGALWTDKMVSDARTKDPVDLIKVIIAVDPAVTNQENSATTGIVACGLDENREGVVIKDHSIKASTGTWAQRVVNAYYEHEANYVVAETNQGGDLVVDALKSIDRSIKVKKVHASKGKFARAEPVSELYELGRIAHLDDFHLLNEELTEYVPLNSKKSPDRLDALVWGITELMLHSQPTIHIGSA